MILCDTGPIVAIINPKDNRHFVCSETLNSLLPPLITTWACFTEAMYLLRKYGGLRAQEELWGYFEDELLMLHINSLEERKRMRSLMKKYHDKPMDFADASLVAAAEALKISRIFTLDKKDFDIYRIHDKKPFEIVP